MWKLTAHVDLQMVQQKLGSYSALAVDVKRSKQGQRWVRHTLLLDHGLHLSPRTSEMVCESAAAAAAEVKMLGTAPVAAGTVPLLVASDTPQLADHTGALSAAASTAPGVPPSGAASVVVRGLALLPVAVAPVQVRHGAD